MARGELDAIARAAEAAGLGKSPGARVIFTGFAVGLIYKTLNVAFKGWKDVPERVFGAPFKAGSVSVEVSPELVGVGYIMLKMELRDQPLLNLHPNRYLIQALVITVLNPKAIFFYMASKPWS